MLGFNMYILCIRTSAPGISTKIRIVIFESTMFPSTLPKKTPALIFNQLNINADIFKNS